MWLLSRGGLQLCAFSVILCNIALLAHVHEDKLLADRRVALRQASPTPFDSPPVPRSGRLLPPPSPPAPREAVDVEHSPPRATMMRQERRDAFFSDLDVCAAYPVATHSARLLTADMPLSRAVALCLSQGECVGFSVRADSARAATVSATFFRGLGNGRHHWNASISEREEIQDIEYAMPLVCDDRWVTFVRITKAAWRSHTSSTTAASATAQAHEGQSSIPQQPPRHPSASPRGHATPEAWSLSVVTQLSLNRFPMLVQLAARWDGPLVAAVAHPPGSPIPSLPDPLPSRVRLVPHPLDHDQPFPINTLRNTAIAAINTTHFLVLDVDLWPSQTLLPELLSLADPWWQSPRIAMLVPAFQVDPIGGAPPPRAGHTVIPTDQNELRRCIAADRCSAFKGQILDGGVHAVPGQQLSTDYPRWLASEQRALPYHLPCFDKTSFEPYLIVRAGAATPPFDENFKGCARPPSRPTSPPHHLDPSPPHLLESAPAGQHW